MQWLSGLARVTGWSQRPACQALVVERLEPRQMLAVDCLFIAEIASSDLEVSEQYAIGSVAGVWQEESLSDASTRYEPQPSQPSLPAASLLDELGEYYLIHLEDVLDEIGQIFEVREDAFGDFEDMNFSWFS
jgi:hypothetical protein